MKDTEDYKTYKSDVNSELMKTDPKVLPRNNPAFEQLRQKIESSSRQVTDIQVIAGIRKDLCTKYGYAPTRSYSKGRIVYSYMSLILYSYILLKRLLDL